MAWVRLHMLIASAIFGLALPAKAAPGDINLELMASPAGFTAGPSLGHAFFCIALDLNSGIKEDCFGFYPKDASGMFVGGPGVVNSEFQKNPGRFANITADFKTVISEEQRRAVYKVVNVFNSANYSITSSNCIDLVLSVAKAAGLATPDHSAIQSPEDFVTAIKESN